MKVLLLGVCTLLLIPAASPVAFKPVLIRSCVRQTRIKPKDLALFYGTLFKEVSGSTKCYINCLLESNGFIIDGELNKDLIEMSKDRQGMSAKEKFAVDLVNACKDVKVPGKCEEGLAMFYCFVGFGQKTPEAPEEE